MAYMGSLRTRLSTAMEMDPSNTPALKPPDGEHSNFVDPYSSHDGLTITASISLFICVLSVAIRIYVRTLLLRQFDLTDGMNPWTLAAAASFCLDAISVDAYSKTGALLISLVGKDQHAHMFRHKSINCCQAFMIVFVALSISSGRYGQGRNQWNVTVADLTKLLEVSFAIKSLPVARCLLNNIDLRSFIGPQHSRDFLRTRYPFCKICSTSTDRNALLSSSGQEPWLQSPLGSHLGEYRILRRLGLLIHFRLRPPRENLAS